MLTISSPHIFDRSNTRSPLMGIERPSSACGIAAQNGPVSDANADVSATQTPNNIAKTPRTPRKEVKSVSRPVNIDEAEARHLGTACDTENDTEPLNLAASSGLLKLIAELRVLLGTKGLASEDIDILEVKRLMEAYESSEADWAHLALHDPSRNYSRNGIFNINGNANLLILVWTPGKASAIHDHANAHCCMKILDGELTESLYDMPAQEGHQLISKKHTKMVRDEVGYISDDIGLHKISNQGTVPAVSLHLYTPPYASMYGCSMYEQGNGKKHHVDMSKYYSWQGKLVDAKGGSTC